MVIFRYSKLDFFLVLYAVAACILPFIISQYSVWVWLLAAPLQAIFNVVVMNTCMHHHVHTPLFRYQFLNRAYELLTTVAVGIPFQSWKWFHLTHHKYNNDAKKNGIVNDPVTFYRFSEPGVRENVWMYCVYGVWRDLTGITANDASCTNRIQINHPDRLRTEVWAFGLWFLALFVCNVWYGAFYIAVYLLSLVLNQANSYGEHYLATDPANFRSDSVGSYSWWFNTFCFNSGYHQEHHVRPGVHWTKLPELTFSLPSNRHTINGMYMFNIPWYNDLKSLIRGNK
jgi:fatty acid desaturase